jgi:hypothetical protein
MLTEKEYTQYMNQIYNFFQSEFKILDKVKQRNRIITSNSFFNMLFQLCSKDSSYANVVYNSKDIHKTVISKTAFMKYRQKVDYTYIEDMYNRFYAFAMKNIFKTECKIYAIDGSKLRLNIKLINEKYALNSSKCYAEGLLSCIYNCEQHIPFKLYLSSNRNERKSYEKQVDSVLKNSILISDRGYYSYKLLKLCKEYNINPIFRMPKDKPECLFKYYNAEIEDDDILDEDDEISISNRKTKFKVRIIKYIIGDEQYLITTTLFDRILYPATYIKELYHTRWKIEEGFKLMKSNITLRNIHSKSENLVQQEVYMNAIIHLFTRITTYLGDKKDLKYTKHKKINTSNCIKVLSSNVYKIFGSKYKLNTTFREILTSIIKVKDYVRDNRSIKRVVITPRSKFKHK